MTFVGNFHCVADIVVITILVVNIGHERHEITIGSAVLIGHIEVEATRAVTHTASDAIGSLPVGEVGC